MSDFQSPDLDLQRHHAEIFNRSQAKAQREVDQQFLRDSLRGSDKLRALQSGEYEKNKERRANRVHPSYDNQSFNDDNSSYQSSNEYYQDKNSNYIQKYLQSQNFCETFKLERIMYRAFMKAETCPPPNTVIAFNLAQNISQSLRNCELRDSSRSGRYRHQMEELNRILSFSKLTSLLLTHDRLADSWYPEWSKKVEEVRKLVAFVPTVAPRHRSEAGSYLKNLNSPDSSNWSSPVRRSQHRQSGAAPDDVFWQEINQTPDGTLLKIVGFEKRRDEPLGATIKAEGEKMVIGRIIAGSLIQRTGLIKDGDQVLKVNESFVNGYQVDDLADSLLEVEGDIKFLIKPVDASADANHIVINSVYFRTLFNYTPDDDIYIPCKELGLSFEKGSIIHVVNTRDSNWWQGFIEENTDQGSIVANPEFIRTYRHSRLSSMSIKLSKLACILPSPNFQYQRQKVLLTAQGVSFTNKVQKDDASLDNADLIDLDMNGCFAVPFTANMVSNSDIQLHTKSTSDIMSIDDLILTYEPVELFFPQPARKRPIVLVGPYQFQLRKLAAKLVDYDRNRFALVPLTSSHNRPNSAKSNNTIVVTKQQFSGFIQKNELIEFGEFESEYFGTRKSSVQELIQKNMVAVLSLAAKSLKIIRSSNMIPYVVFLDPPRATHKIRELFRETNREVGECSILTDQQLTDLILVAGLMQKRYGHMFDLLIEHEKISDTIDKLIDIADKLESNPQWVARDWLPQSSASSLTSPYSVSKLNSPNGDLNRQSNYYNYNFLKA